MPLCYIYNSNGKELLRFSTEDFSGRSRITVGRSSKCDVSLKRLADSNISREHFYLSADLHGQWSIHDTSRAGIVIDCAKVERAALLSGSIVRFGQLFFGFGERALPSHYYLTWFNSDLNVEQCGCLWRGENSIGASRDNYVCIRLGAVSRFHCCISVNDAELTLANINPMVETAVNDEPLLQGHTRIKPGDVLLLGDVEVTVREKLAGSVRVGDILTKQELKKRNSGVAKRTKQRALLAFAVILLLVLCILGMVVGALRMLPDA